MTTSTAIIIALVIVFVEITALISMIIYLIKEFISFLANRKQDKIA